MMPAAVPCASHYWTCLGYLGCCDTNRNDPICVTCYWHSKLHQGETCKGKLKLQKVKLEINIADMIIHPQSKKHNIFSGHIFSHVRPFYERAV